MNVRLDSLIPFDAIKTDTEGVFSIVDKNDKVVLLKDNQPAYIIIKYNATQDFDTTISPFDGTNYTLQEAMKLVLSEAPENTMHASQLAEEIYTRRLYLQKNGDKAQYNQIRARCSHYSNMFEALSGNYIKLKDDVEMTNEQRILSKLEAIKPARLCDDCLSKELDITPRQQVNQICNRLSQNALIIREKGVCERGEIDKYVNGL